MDGWLQHDWCASFPGIWNSAWANLTISWYQDLYYVKHRVRWQFSATCFGKWEEQCYNMTEENEENTLKKKRNWCTERKKTGSLHDSCPCSKSFLRLNYINHCIPRDSLVSFQQIAVCGLSHCTWGFVTWSWEILIKILFWRRSLWAEAYTSGSTSMMDRRWS